MTTANELQTRNFDSSLAIPSAARNNMFSLEERFEILKTYFQSQCCVAETVRILKRNMGRDVNWPARSCDLTPLDFFLWGAVKDRCYADNPETIPALKNNITTVLSEIGAEVVQNVVTEWHTVRPVEGAT